MSSVGDSRNDRTLRRKVKPSITPFGLNCGESLVLSLLDGSKWEMTLLHTSAEITAHGYGRYGNGDTGHGSGDISAYAFTCDLMINGHTTTLRREVGTQESFYEPWLIDGVNLWFDATRAIFQDFGGFMVEKDWRGGTLCQPDHDARFAVQEAGVSICPESMEMWFDLPSRQLDIKKCYYGEDCWMGPYGGIATHCGLDINMLAGTKLNAPINFDDQYYFATVTAGFGNNRWRGVRRWDDGSEWQLQTHHLIEPLVEQRTPLLRGTSYATTAGVAVGAFEHTHFLFRIIEQGGAYLLDPWILFWQMFKDASK